MSRAELIASREGFLVGASTFLNAKSQQLANEYRHEAASLRKTAGKGIPKQTELECSSCGSLDICERTINITRRLSRKTKEEYELRLLQCQFCSRTTKVKIPSTGPLQKSKIEVTASKNIPKSVAVASSASLTSAKTSSKKRAKERKNREGLQAMLSRDKKPTQTPATFGLLDFMSKQG